MRPKIPTLLAGIALFASTVCAAAAEPPPTFRLDDRATPRGYEAHLAVDPRESRFSGEIRIELAFNRATPVLWLNATHLTIESARFEQGARSVAVRVIEGGEDFVGFEAQDQPFAAGPAIATVRYQGTIDPVSPRGIFRQTEGGDSYVFSQFEPLDARRAFPCFDEPGFKTPWRLTIDAPAGLEVVSNTPELSAADVPGRAGWRRHAFAATPSVPSYLVALAAGPFEIVDGGTAGARKTPLRYVVPRGRGAETRYAREATPRILELLEDYFGIPYPFEKLDSVAIPQFPGAMENAGLITYDARSLVAQPHEETDRHKRNYASVAAHEIGHHWFGDYMTLAWWDDIWLNEAFASWIQEKVVYQLEPKWDDGKEHAWGRRKALESDRLASARRIRNAVNGKGDVHAAFDGITYQKGAEVLAMFEAAFTPAKFREGVRLFLRRHAWATATSADFFRALGEASGRNADALKAFATFVEQPGVPLISASLRCETGGASLQISQQRLRPAGSTAAPMEWITPACFRYPSARGVATQCAEVGSAKTRVALADTPHCPAWVAGNAGGVGHYVMDYDASLARRLTRNFASLPVHEAVALVGDAALLAKSGLETRDRALDWADAALTHPSPLVQLTAVDLLEQQRDAWLDANQARRKRSILAQRVVPLAQRVGWRANPGEGAEVAELRNVLLPFAAQSPEGRNLRPEARAMALAWIADRKAVEAEVVTAVLLTAARFADADTFERLEAATLTIEAQRDRRSLLKTIGKVRDPRLSSRALALALAKKDGVDGLNGANTMDLVYFTLEDDVSRAAGFDFLRAHFEPLVAKLPEDTPVGLIAQLGRLCTPAERSAFTGFFETRASRFVGGEISYRQALESIDLCLAARARK